MDIKDIIKASKRLRKVHRSRREILKALAEITGNEGHPKFSVDYLKNILGI